MVKLCFLVVFLLGVGLPAPLFAQDREAEARTYFESGTLAYNDARWIDCARDFERSFQIVFAPELLYNVGVCYQRASSALPDAEAAPLLERALAAFQRYLRELPESEDGPAVQRQIDDLQARLTRMSLPVEESEAEPEVAPEPVEALPEPEAELVFERVSRNEYPATIFSGSLTLVSFVLAIGIGVYAQDTYNGLRDSCGQTVEGCSSGSIDSVNSLALATNILYGISGVSLAGTAVGFGVEFSATDSRPMRVSLMVGGRF